VITVFVLIACDTWGKIPALVCAIFFACWWTAAAGVLTYDAPYLSLGNAYLGTWIATVCSYLILLDVMLWDGDGTEVEEGVPPAMVSENRVVTSNEPAQEVK